MFISCVPFIAASFMAFNHSIATVIYTDSSTSRNNAPQQSPV